MRPLSPQEVKSLRCRLQQGRHAQSLLRRSTLKSQLSAPSKCTRRPASSASSAGAAIGEFDAALGAAASVEALPALPASRPAECTCNVRRLAERHAVQLKLQRCTTGFNAPASPSPSPPKTASSASAGSGGGHGGAGGSAPSDIAAERADCWQTHRIRHRGQASKKELQTAGASTGTEVNGAADLRWTPGGILRLYNTPSFTSSTELRDDATTNGTDELKKATAKQHSE